MSKIEDEKTPITTVNLTDAEVATFAKISSVEASDDSPLGFSNEVEVNSTEFSKATAKLQKLGLLEKKKPPTMTPDSKRIAEILANPAGEVFLILGTSEILRINKLYFQRFASNSIVAYQRLQKGDNQLSFFTSPDDLTQAMDVLINYRKLEDNVNFTARLNAEELVAFICLLDWYRTADLRSVLNRQVKPDTSFTENELMDTLRWGRELEDLRWCTTLGVILFPYVNFDIDEAAIAKGIKGLSKKGHIVKKKESYDFTSEMVLLCKLFYPLISFTGFNINSTVSTDQTLISAMRGPEAILTFEAANLNDPAVTVTSVNSQGFRSKLHECMLTLLHKTPLEEPALEVPHEKVEKRPIGRTCPNCNAQIPTSNKFCPNCGKRIPRRQPVEKGKPKKYCTNCGARLRKKDKSCLKCGAKVAREI